MDRNKRIRGAERAILVAEGPFHVGGIYYAGPLHAEHRRHWLAEQRVREAERHAAYLQRQLETVATPRTRDEARTMPMPCGVFSGRPLAEVPDAELCALLEHLDARRQAGTLTATGEAYAVAIERVLNLVPASAA